ncbi:pentatricopeptide repeat-containing protein At3g49170, chloroplastic-like [Eucalyptus grandis]|uniref:pentatricopeptide repeat-containing protein At3g49170, chloroplastic-like n=1 Tax=Eucalyptus grandis TaxID=71139 RepID=UPI00192EF14E|nr:pentatricopeptide repeat-containing protein At3g49170, chloroplastic-like [Eucalyptus grandis]
MGNNRDLVSWSSMSSCYANNHIADEAVDILAHLLEDGCASIDMFSKDSADLISAHKLFEKMPERSVVAWTLMMTRCTQLGGPKNAVDLFLDILLGGHSGHMEDAQKALDALFEKNLISHDTHADAYAKMELPVLALLVRGCNSGLASNQCILNGLISMYSRADTLVWHTFLRACPVHGNVELAKQAAAMIFGWEPDNLAAFVLLSNVYASTGLREDGCSWTEAKK